MKKLILLSLIFVALFACKNNTTTKNVKSDVVDTTTVSNEKGKVVIQDEQYTEYYPNSKKVKFHGEIDAQNRRDGKWVYYGENGQELSISFYSHGLKDGHTIVKYPNGSIRYVGDYKQDKRVGEWEFYDEKGNKTTKKF